MKIISLQLPVRLAEPDKNLSVYRDKLSQMTDNDNTIVILPEMWACGFDYGNLVSFSERSAEILSSIQAIINDNTLIISSLPEKNQNKVFNTVYAVDKTGVIAQYRKNFLFSPTGEDKYIDKGNGVKVFDYKGIKVGLLLCYEIRFPEMCRLTAFAGADVVAVPAIWPQIKKDHWLTLLRARAIENECYFVGGNASVMHGRKDMACGYSAAFDPWGEPLYEPSAEEGVYTAEISKEFVTEIRTKIPSFNDARDFFDINGKNR